jgi:hypothetical protein
MAENAKGLTTSRDCLGGGGRWVGQKFSGSFLASAQVRSRRVPICLQHSRLENDCRGRPVRVASDFAQRNFSMTNDIEPSRLLGLSEIAKLRGLSPRTIRRNVTEWERKGLLTCSRKDSRKLIDLATYDRLAEQHHDPGQVAAWKKRRGEPSASQESQASKVRYEAELKKLELLNRRRELVPISGARGVAAAANNAASAIVRVIDGLPSRAADMVAAVNKGGEHGARTLLRALTVEIRKTITAEMTALARHGQEAEAKANLSLDFELSETGTR